MDYIRLRELNAKQLVFATVSTSLTMLFCFEAQGDGFRRHLGICMSMPRAALRPCSRSSKDRRLPDFAWRPIVFKTSANSREHQAVNRPLVVTTIWSLVFRQSPDIDSHHQTPSYRLARIPTFAMRPTDNPLILIKESICITAGEKGDVERPQSRCRHLFCFAHLPTGHCTKPRRKLKGLSATLFMTLPRSIGY